MVRSQLGSCKFIWLLLLLAVGFGWCGELLAGSLEESRQTLEEIERRIDQATRALAEKQASEQALGEDLKAIEKELTAIRARVAGQARRLAEVEGEIASGETEAARLKAELRLLEVKVGQRLAALYKSGDTGVLRVLFGNSPPARMAEDYEFLGRVVRRDRELLTDFRRRLAALEDLLRRLTGLRQEQQALLINSRQDQANLRQAVRLQEKLLSQVRKDRATLAGHLEDLKEKARRLAALVKKLESEKPSEYTGKSGVFSSQQGRLPWPATGNLKVGFGRWLHPELATYYDSQGIEIGVPAPQAIKAVWPGRVIFANWFKGYGNLLILDHGEGYYTLYAQAARLTRKVGDLLNQGEVLGESGFEGADHIYFEIRHRGRPLDPTAWLEPR